MFNEKPFVQLMQSLKNCNEEDIPTSALLEMEGKTFGPFNNEVYKEKSHLFHAEILAIDNALKEMKLMDFKNTKAVLYSTLEPCCLCLSFASLTRVSKIIYYAEDKKFGGTARIFTLDSAFYRPELIFIEKEEVKILLNNFFKSKR
jgi:tRNA(adenine34) deaminase